MKKLLLLLLLLSLTLTMSLYAQNFNNSGVSMTITGTVGQVQRITLPADQNFNLTGSSANGIVTLGEMQVFSNVPYSLTVDSTNNFELTSTTTAETINYNLTIGNDTVNESTGDVLSNSARTNQPDSHTIELIYVQDTANSLTPANDYTDTLTFSIATP